MEGETYTQIEPTGMMADKLPPHPKRSGSLPRVLKKKTTLWGAEKLS